MKQLMIFFTVTLSFPILLFSQHLRNLDYVSPFHEELAAIQKGDSWGFINTQGELVIDFRDDVVIMVDEGDRYPIFNSGRCLISKEENGITYFGYIDKNGHEVLKPQFLNATKFNDGLAIILKLYKDVIGRNDVLDKAMIDYNYMELAINPDGEIVHYISDKPTHVTLSKYFMPGPPPIKSKLLTDSLIAIKNNDNKWTIKKV